ncbi:COX15/CtaA family protein [Pedobacter alpinus]|uniref:Heme A synthase n=1 Tax=Pedobacter alpinus TaxID=1590643 RepID=A0ABW5TNP2_9SPHI
MHSKAEKRFLLANLTTLISLFLLILAGGVVRSSGSGMGCPDWPKCFDQYIPPTDITQLPLDYKEKYVEQRIAKNERFAKLLDKAGYTDLAVKVRHDETIGIPEEFNAAKTYIEYINRLIGALTGLFLLACFFYSISLLKTKPIVFWLSFLNLFLVVFQAWLGSIVVSTNLLAWVITVHMLVAILILGVALYTYFAVKTHVFNLKISLKQLWLLRIVSLLVIIVSVIQITVGTEVREGIDAVKITFPELERSLWLTETGRIFTQHKDLVWLYLGLSLVFFTLIKRTRITGLLQNLSLIMILLFLAQVFTGLVLTYFALAPWAQAAHVLLATILFSVQLYLLFIVFSKKENLIKL